jgi:hypothetical protein
MACAAGGAVAGGDGAGANVAPGKPVPGVSGTGTVCCGEIRLWVWATAAGGASSVNSNVADAAQPRTPLAPHAGMRFFSIAIAAISSLAAGGRYGDFHRGTSPYKW